MARVARDSGRGLSAEENVLPGRHGHPHSGLAFYSLQPPRRRGDILSPRLREGFGGAAVRLVLLPD